MTPLAACLTLSAIIFGVGLAGALLRRNAIIVLISIELMLNAANLNFLAFSKYGPQSQAIDGTLFVLFSIAIAAAEAAVGLALIVCVYRHFKSTDLSLLNTLKG